MENQTGICMSGYEWVNEEVLISGGTVDVPYTHTQMHRSRSQDDSSCSSTESVEKEGKCLMSGSSF